MLSIGWPWAFAALETCMEAGKKQVRLASETRDPKDVLALGSELTMELGERLTTMVREAVEINGEIQDELQAWFHDGWKTVAAKAPAAPKKKAA